METRIFSMYGSMFFIIYAENKITDICDSCADHTKRNFFLESIDCLGTFKNPIITSLLSRTHKGGIDLSTAWKKVERVEVIITKSI